MRVRRKRKNVFVGNNLFITKETRINVQFERIELQETRMRIKSMNTKHQCTHTRSRHARTSVDNYGIRIIIVKYYVHVCIRRIRYTETLHNIQVTIINKKITLKSRTLSISRSERILAFKGSSMEQPLQATTTFLREQIKESKTTVETPRSPAFNLCITKTMIFVLLQR